MNINPPRGSEADTYSSYPKSTPERILDPSQKSLYTTSRNEDNIISLGYGSSAFPF
jgi:hypothetical protein